MADLNALRNLAFVGQIATGKTTLVEGLANTAGLTNRMGTVEDGSTLTDFLDEEKARRMSLNAAFLPLSYRDTQITVIDCPGSMEFANEARGIVRGVDVVVGVISAAEGLEVGTEKPLGWAGEAGCARLIFVNKMDMERANFARCLEDLKDTYSGITPLQIPIGAGTEFKGVVDLLRMKAFARENDKVVELEIPADLKKAAEDAHNNLVENVAVSDEALMERYLEEGALPFEVLAEALRKAIARGEVIPVVCGAAKANKGSKALLDVIVDFCPGPGAMAPPKGTLKGEDVEVSADPAAPPVAFVMKTIVDQFLGRLAVVRMQAGTIKGDSPLYNPRTETKTKSGPVYLVTAKEFKPTDTLSAGQIGAIGKLEEIATGDTIATEARPVRLAGVEWPTPVYALAIFPKTKADETRLSTGLARLAEEDPFFKWERNPETRETVALGMGQLHLDTVLKRLEHRFNTAVDTQLPQISYKETIKGVAEVQGRHKKQTGGRGQFGDVWIRIEPLQRGSGFEFVDAVVGGTVPKNFIPAVEKGLVEAIARGAIAGYPGVDMRMTLYDGSYHNVDSSEMAFKIAASLAFKKGMETAKPILLEPVYEITVEVPAEYMGDIMGDLSSKRGRISNSEQRGKNAVIKALVPLEEIQKYSADLNSITAGKGTFSRQFSHYDEVPGDRATKIVEARKELVTAEAG